MALWGLFETKAEKELKKLQEEVAAKSAEEARKAEAEAQAKAEAEAKAAEEASKAVTLKDIGTVASKYGKQLIDQAKTTGSELLTDAGAKTAEIKNTVVTEFNKQSAKAVVSVVEAAYSVTKKATELKNKFLKK